MTHFNQNESRGKKFLKSLEALLDLLVDHLPRLSSKLGKLAVSVFDVVAGGLFLSYVFGTLTPPDYLKVAKVFAWLISAATYFFVNDLFEQGQSHPDKKLFAWILNIFDAFFIDAAGVFILFGATGIIQGGWAGFMSAVQAMPIVGWVLYLIAAALSLFAEWYRVGDKKPSSPAQPQTFRPQTPPAQPQTFRPQTPPVPGQPTTFRPQTPPAPQTFRPAPAPYQAPPTGPTYHPQSGDEHESGGGDGHEHNT